MARLSKEDLEKMKRDFVIIEDIIADNNTRDSKEQAKNFKHQKAYSPTWEFKKYFLERCKADESISYYRLRDIYRLMFKIGKWENRYNKDAYDFTYEELKGMLQEFNATSDSSLITQKSNLEFYLQFARAKNQGDMKTSAIININAEELKLMVNHIGYASKFITREELYNGRHILVNLQDQVLPLMMFEGFRGNHCEDIINLKWKDVNFTENTIKINGKTRDIDETLSNILRKMNDDKVYAIKNGDYERGERINKKTGTISNVGRESGDRPLLQKWESEYLFRPTVERDDNLGRLTYQTIQRRVKDVMVNFYNKPTVSMTTIYISGLIERAINYSDNVLGSVMRNVDFQRWLSENNEGVNIQDTYKSYLKFYNEKFGVDEEEEENLE